MLRLTDATAALLLAADLVVVVVSVLLRSWLNAPVEWADDVARGLMVGSSFFGAASAIARAENPGVSFFVDLLPAGPRRIVDSAGALLVVVESAYVAWTALALGWLTDEPLAIIAECDNRRRGPHAFGVFDDFRRLAIHYGDARIRGAKIDPNDLSHGPHTLLFAAGWLGPDGAPIQTPNIKCSRTCDGEPHIGGGVGPARTGRNLSP